MPTAQVVQHRLTPLRQSPYSRRKRLRILFKIRELQDSGTGMPEATKQVTMQELGKHLSEKTIYNWRTAERRERALDTTEKVEFDEVMNYIRATDIEKLLLLDEAISKRHSLLMRTLNEEDDNE